LFQQGLLISNTNFIIGPFCLSFVQCVPLISRKSPFIMWELMGELERRRHPQKALTVRAVQAAQAGDRTRRIADGGGLYLSVSPSGAKT